MADLNMSALRLQLSSLYVSGLLPPPSWMKSKWKMMIHDIATTFTLISVFPAIVLQMIYLYQNLNDLEMVTATVYQMFTFSNVAILFAYFRWNRNALLDLINLAETSFTSHLTKVGSPEKQKAIFTESKRKSKVIIYPLQGFTLFAFVCWAIVPCVLGYVDYFILNKSESEMAEGKGNYFGLLWWTPETVHKSPVYEMVQIFHFIITYFSCWNFSACCMAMFAFQFYTATLFKVLCVAFEDMDLLMTRKQIIRNGFNEENQTTDLSTYENKKGEKTISDNGRPERYSNNEESDQWNEFQISTHSAHIKTQLIFYEHDKLIRIHLIDCVKFHQEIIVFTDKINDLLSPAMFIFFVLTEAMLCLSAFQLAMGEFNDKKLKFLFSALGTAFWPFFLCWCGDDLISTAVKQSVFNCSWYEQSTEFNKLLGMVMMRAHKPVTITAGKFYIASLQTYAEIAHKVYAYFTLLKQLYDGN